MSSEAERPVPPSLPTADNVPAELRHLKRWVGWRAQWDESKKKWKKPPHSPVTGKGIGAVEKYIDHWLTFDEAIDGVHKHGLDGVGFVFKDGDGYVGIDFDDCRTTDGTLDPAAAAWLRWFPTYTEISPSGTGIHLICKGKLSKALTATPLVLNGSAKVEMYSKDRYFTFTGHSEKNLNPSDCQDSIQKLLSAVIGGDPKAFEEEDDGVHPMHKRTAVRMHSENLEALRNAAQGEGNALLNTAAFFGGRAFAAGALEGTAEEIQKVILDIVLKEWKSPHPEHGARMTVESGWRSGTEQPLLIGEDNFPEVESMLKEFEHLFLIKNYGGKARVAYEELNRLVKGLSYLLMTQPVGDWRIGYQDEMITTGLKDDGQPRIEDKATAWLKNRNKRKYDKVVFEPNVKTPAHIYNLWRGFAFVPKKGDCSLYLAHVRENICDNDPIKYRYCIGWMAYAVRHPDEPGHVAIVVQGLKGVGKNVFAERFADLWGQHQLVVSDQSRITNNFNAHLRDKCVLIADEAFFAGDRKHEGNLKGLVTGNTIQIEPKGVDSVTVPNLLHIIILGNEDWLVPATEDERRYFAIRCSAAHRGKKPYFKAIQDQLDNGGYEALLHHLLYEVDLTDFEVREAPHTRELIAQMAQSLRNVEAAWFECLHLGNLPGRLESDGTARMRSIDFFNWAASQKGRFWNDLRVQALSSLFGKTGKDKKKGMGFSSVQGTRQGDRSRYWIIPKLSECREIWSERRFNGEWSEETECWSSILDADVNF